MIKLTAVSLVAVAMLSAGAVFAKEEGDAACCVKGASNKAACADFASMKLTADQKTKLEAWQAECMKAGCTKESRTAFLKKAEGILSKDQYAMLKAQCEKSAADKKTQT
jgi:hypothetical protein